MEKIQSDYAALNGYVFTQEEKEHCKQIANRQIKACDDFVYILQEIAGITKKQGYDVLNLMIQQKMVKLDTWMGRYSVKHGSFLDKDYIERLVIHTGAVKNG